MKTFLMYAIIILIIIAPAYYFYAPESMKFWRNESTATGTATTTPEEILAPQPDRITAKHQFKNGKHIVAGEITQPTPCYVLTTDARVAESMPEQVTLIFTSKTTADVCAQVITTDRFKIEFEATEKATINATWNGSPVQLNLIPAGPNEDLNNFDIFIKG
jgi:hypothetical protein